MTSCTEVSPPAGGPPDTRFPYSTGPREVGKMASPMEGGGGARIGRLSEDACGGSWVKVDRKLDPWAWLPTPPSATDPCCCCKWEELGWCLDAPDSDLVLLLGRLRPPPLGACSRELGRGVAEEEEKWAWRSDS